MRERKAERCVQRKVGAVLEVDRSHFVRNDPVARRQHGLLDYGGNLAQRVRFAPRQKFPPLSVERIIRSVRISLSRSSRQLNNRFRIVESPPFISFELSQNEDAPLIPSRLPSS